MDCSANVSVVSAQRHGNCAFARLATGTIALIDESQDRHDPLLDLIAAIQIHFKRTADRIADVLFKRVQRFIELAQQECFFGRMGVQQHHSVHVTVRHAENVIRLMHQIRRQHAAALAGNINSQFLHGFDRIRTGGLAFHRAKSGGHRTVISVALDGMAKNSFGHGTAANVPRANEKNRLH